MDIGDVRIGLRYIPGETAVIHSKICKVRSVGYILYVPDACDNETLPLINGKVTGIGSDGYLISEIFAGDTWVNTHNFRIPTELIGKKFKLEFLHPHVYSITLCDTGETTYHWYGDIAFKPLIELLISRTENDLDNYFPCLEYDATKAEPVKYSRVPKYSLATHDFEESVPLVLDTEGEGIVQGLRMPYSLPEDVVYLRVISGTWKDYLFMKVKGIPDWVTCAYTWDDAGMHMLYM